MGFRRNRSSASFAVARSPIIRRLKTDYPGEFPNSRFRPGSFALATSKQSPDEDRQAEQECRRLDVEVRYRGGLVSGNDTSRRMRELSFQRKADQDDFVLPLREPSEGSRFATGPVRVGTERFEIDRQILVEGAKRFYVGTHRHQDRRDGGRRENSPRADEYREKTITGQPQPCRDEGVRRQFQRHPCY